MFCSRPATKGAMDELIDLEFERFQQVLRAQAELYRTLLALAKRQAAEISARNIKGFIAALDEKKLVLEEIGSLELTAAPLRHAWESQSEVVTDQTRARVRSLVEEIRTLLQQLLEVEMESQTELGVVKDTVEEELRQVTTGPEAIRSYKGPNQCKPRFMNEIG